VATTNKDFIVKNGLVVEGAFGTIDGENIVTEASLGTSLGSYIALTEKGNAEGVATLDANSNVLTSTAVIFEGATEDSYQTTVDVVDPTDDRTITFPNATGTVALTTDIPSVSGMITASEYSAKGKILVGTGTGTFTALSVGATNGHILTVDSAEASGVKWAASSGGGGGGGGFTISDTAPSAPAEGSAWFDSTTGYTYIYYNDGNSSQWIQLLGTPGPQGPAGPAGATGATGPSSLPPDDDQFVLSSRIFA
jgi:hypothetical protein